MYSLIFEQRFIAAGENKILQSQAVTLAESKFELERTVIGLRKEMDDIRDACLESERNSRTLLHESRKEKDCVSAITFRLRFSNSVPNSVSANRKSGAIIRYESVVKGKENSRYRGCGDGFFVFSSCEIIDFIGCDIKFLFIFG